MPDPTSSRATLFLSLGILGRTRLLNTEWGQQRALVEEAVVTGVTGQLGQPCSPGLGETFLVPVSSWICIWGPSSLGTWPCMAVGGRGGQGS